jgi:hypothetical protein
MDAASVDYLGLTPQERMDTALTDLIGGGIARNKAISLVALSVSESSIFWTVARSALMENVISNAAGGPANLPVKECWPVRTAIGIEPETWITRANGSRIGTLPTSLADGSSDNYTVITFLQAAQMLSATKDSGEGTPRFTFMGPAMQPNSGAISQFFETVVYYRLADWLKVFSIGPTQMWLALSGPAGGTASAWPHTWEDIWAFYTQHTVADLANRITYLDDATPWPADDDSQANVLRWLSHQTGSGVNSTRTLCYYSTDTCPGGAGWVADYKGNLAWARSRASALNL